MIYRPNTPYCKEFVISNPTTGAAVNADSLPVAKANRNGTDDAGFVLAVTNIDTGRYKITGTVPVGYGIGDVVNVSVSATAILVAAKAIVDTFTVDTTLSSDNSAAVAALQTSVNAIPTAPLLAADARLNSLDAAISSRSVYAGGPVASVTAPVALTTAYDAAKTAASQASVNAIPTAPLLAANYTAPDNASITAIKNRTDNLPNSPAAVGSPMGAVDSVVAPVTLAGDLTLAMKASVTAAASASHPIVDNVALSAEQPYYAPAKAGDAMALTPTERGVLATVIEGALMNDSDGQALLAAIVAKVNATDVDLAGLSVGAIASGVAGALLVSPMHKLATDGTGRVTVGVNEDKSGYSGVATNMVEAPNNLAVAAIKAKTDNLPNSPAAVGSDMGAVTSVTGPVNSVTQPVTLAGDLTPTMKASVTQAASAATPVASVSGDFSNTMKASITAAAATAVPTVVLSATQDLYAPAKAGDAMALAPGERTALAGVIWAAGGRTLTGFGSLVDDIKAAVWGATSRTLTGFGFSVTAATVTDKAGYSLEVTPPTAAEIRTAMDADSSMLSGMSATLATVLTAAQASQVQAAMSRKMQTNKASVSGDGRTVYVYDDDGVTLLLSFAISADNRTREPL